MESDRDRAASNNLDRKQGCPRASSPSCPLDEKLKDIFMDVTLCRFGICIYWWNTFRSTQENQTLIHFTAKIMTYIFRYEYLRIASACFIGISVSRINFTAWTSHHKHNKQNILWCKVINYMCTVDYKNFVSEEPQQTINVRLKLKN